MAEEIKDGTGSGSKSRVDKNNQLHVFAVTEDEQKQAASEGNEYNLNTGRVAYTGTGESSVIYFENQEEQDFIITAVAAGLGVRSGTVSDNAYLNIYSNPTGGDIISDAAAIDMRSNTNFASSKSLSTSTLTYKGKDGGTLTGGTLHDTLDLKDGRSFAGLNIELPKGSAVGVTIDLNTTGGANLYVALIGYVKDADNK